jgi:hypothetical protein
LTAALHAFDSLALSLNFASSDKFPATRTEMKNFMKALAAWSLPLVACGLKLAACRLNLFTKNFESL